MHNGMISEFGRIKRELILSVDPELYPLIQGTTDSEVLFHLALTLGLRDDPVDAMRQAIGLVETTGRSTGVQFPWQGTVAATDGSTIWAFRYSTQGRTRSLFHSVDLTTLRELYPDVERLNLFSDDAHVVVSEPFNDLPGTFVEVPESTVAVLDASGYRHHDFNPSSTTSRR